MKEHDIKYFNKVTCDFSEAVFQHMASIRHGIEFCCGLDLTQLEISKGLLDLNGMADIELTPVPIPPPPPEPLPLTSYCLYCCDLESPRGTGRPPVTFLEMSSMVSNGHRGYDLDPWLFGRGASQAERDYLYNLVPFLWGDTLTEDLLSVAITVLDAHSSEPYAHDLRNIVFATRDCLSNCLTLPGTCIAQA